MLFEGDGRLCTIVGVRQAAELMQIRKDTGDLLGAAGDGRH